MKIKLTPVTVFEVQTKEGPMLLRQHGEPWNGMRELRTLDGHHRVVVGGDPEPDRGTLRSVFDDIFGAPARLAVAVSASSWLAERLTPEAPEGEA